MPSNPPHPALGTLLWRCATLLGRLAAGGKVAALGARPGTPLLSAAETGAAGARWTQLAPVLTVRRELERRDGRPLWSAAGEAALGSGTPRPGTTLPI